MKELINHIEYLLLENDCVILPNFGGFITHHVPAIWVEEENLFLPPYRTVGFNAQLKINDGLLVQSYMQTYDATYPEATRLVENAIELFAENLYKEGFVEMYGIGTLHRTISGEYQFEPTENGVITPELYGFGALPITPLSSLAQTSKEPIRITVPVSTPQITAIDEKEKVEEREVEAGIFEEDINETVAPTFTSNTTEEKAWVIKIKHQWLANIISVAAAVLLFFALSIPVDNTYIEEENFASLGSLDLLKQLNGRSMVTTLLPNSKEELPYSTIIPTEVNNTASTIVTTEPVAETEKEESETSVTSSTTTSTTTVEVVEIQTTTQPEIKKEVSTNTETITEKPAAQKAKTKSYNVIVASVPTQEDADRMVSEYIAQGYQQAVCISGSGRFRISIATFDTELKAYQKINELKEQGAFKDAWVLTRRQ